MIKEHLEPVENMLITSKDNWDYYIGLVIEYIETQNEKVLNKIIKETELILSFLFDHERLCTSMNTHIGLKTTVHIRAYINVYRGKSGT